MKEKDDCCNNTKAHSNSKPILDSTTNYVCYCNTVLEEDIKNAIFAGASTIAQVIKATGAMKNSNCPVNNPKGVCCYPDIVTVCQKYL